MNVAVMKTYRFAFGASSDLSFASSFAVSAGLSAAPSDVLEPISISISLPVKTSPNRNW